MKCLLVCSVNRPGSLRRGGRMTCSSVRPWIWHQLKQHDPLASSEIGDPRRSLGMAGERGPAGYRPARRTRASRRDCQRSDRQQRGRSESSQQLVGVPPVGVEPTLGTLLGGRPLPLGYGGWVMIPRWVRTILALANGGRKIRPSAHIQFVRSDPRMRSVTNFRGAWKKSTHSVAVPGGI